MDKQQTTARPSCRRPTKLHSVEDTIQEVSSIEWEVINMTEQEEDLIERMYSLVGNRWDLIAGRIPTRKPEEIERFVLMKEQQGLMRRRN